VIEISASPVVGEKQSRVLETAGQVQKFPTWSSRARDGSQPHRSRSFVRRAADYAN